MSSIMTSIVRIMCNHRKVNVAHVCAFHQDVKRLWINDTGQHWNVRFSIYHVVLYIICTYSYWLAPSVLNYSL